MAHSNCPAGCWACNFAHRLTCQCIHTPITLLLYDLYLDWLVFSIVSLHAFEVNNKVIVFVLQNNMWRWRGASKPQGLQGLYPFTDVQGLHFLRVLWLWNLSLLRLQLPDLHWLHKECKKLSIYGPDVTHSLCGFFVPIIASPLSFFSKIRRERERDTEYPVLRVLLCSSAGLKLF